MLSRQPGLFFTTLVALFVGLSLYLLYRDGTLERGLFYIYLTANLGNTSQISIIDIDKILSSENLAVERFVADGVNEASSQAEIRQHAIVSEKVAEIGPIFINSNCESKPVSVLLSIGESIRVENKDNAEHLFVIGRDRIKIAPGSSVELVGDFSSTPATVPYYCDGEKKGVVVIRYI
ncbi:MAG: hypothetical protein AAB597_02025 [Patescibacteria group bacterium]